MCNSKNCPACKQPVLIDDFVSCQNKDCQEFNLKYLQYEFNELCDDLIKLELAEEDSINEQS